MKQVWLYANNNANEDQHTFASYFFHGRSPNILQKSPLGMVRSILYQLLDGDRGLCEEFMPLFLENRKKHGPEFDWHFGELKTFLLDSVRQWGAKPVGLLIDALDECSDNEAQSVVSMLESLGRSAMESGKVLNICLSSRHYPNIRMHAAAELALDSQADHDEDIRKYVSSNLICNNTSIEQEVLRKANHVFLWVELVVKMLNKAYIDGQVRKMEKLLREEPSDLNELYIRILTEGQTTQDLRECVLILQWVLFAKRTLSSKELHFAVLSGTEADELDAWNEQVETFQIIEKNITIVSRGLIEVREQKDHWGKTMRTTQFIHESVKDFLLREGGLQRLDSSLSPQIIGNSNSRLAEYCLAYIMVYPIEIMALKLTAGSTAIHPRKAGEKLNGDFPFLDYAIQNVLFHANQAEAENVSQIPLLQLLQPSSKEYQRMQLLAEKCDLGYWGRNTRLLHLAAHEGQYELVRVALDQLEADVNLLSGHYGTALHTATFKGSVGIVQLLLQHGADVNLLDGEYGTASQAAAAGGYIEIVQLLLQHGTDVNLLGGRFGTALQAAAYSGAEDIARLLIRKYADVNAKGGAYYTALHAAVWTGHVSVAKLLIENGAEVNARSNEIGTPLFEVKRPRWYMGEETREKITELLVESGGVDLPRIRKPALAQESEATSMDSDGGRRKRRRDETDAGDSDGRMRAKSV